MTVNNPPPPQGGDNNNHEPRKKWSVDDSALATSTSSSSSQRDSSAWVGVSSSSVHFDKSGTGFVGLSNQGKLPNYKIQYYYIKPTHAPHTWSNTNKHNNNIFTIM